MAQKTIALIICSTRTPRVGPSISTWITTLLTSHIPSHIRLTTHDLATFPLPLSPLSPTPATIPARLPNPLPSSPYADPHVNAWSAAVRDADAFIFVTPQYNWSIPGALKVAIDHLFHEWGGKPMFMVTYGARGGGKAAGHLRDIWTGLRGGECVGGVELALGGGEPMNRVQQEGELDKEITERWVVEGKDKEVVEGWGRLVGALGEGV